MKECAKFTHIVKPKFSSDILISRNFCIVTHNFKKKLWNQENLWIVEEKFLIGYLFFDVIHFLSKTQENPIKCDNLEISYLHCRYRI